MKTTTVPTLDELNAIQADWMALAWDAPEAEQRRVIDAMKRTPSVYASVNASATGAIVMLPGQPMQALPISLDKARKILQEMGARTDVAWQADKYIAWPTN